MAKIRTIKPEFWDDEKLGRLKRDVRLLFAGMFNFSDDAGVIKANPVYIKSRIFPYDEDLRVNEVKSWLDKLVEARMLIPFSYNGESYYIIRTFNQHQMIDKRYARHIIPPELIEKEKTIDNKHLKSTSCTLGDNIVNTSQEMEGKGKEMEMEMEGEKTTSVFGKSAANSAKSIDELMNDCLRDQINFVEYVCRQHKISEHQLINALKAFNDRLRSGLEMLKTPKDYRFHFQNWLAKQDKKQFRLNPTQQEKATSVQEILKKAGIEGI